MKNEKQFDDLKTKLIEENFYGSDHPFLCSESGFYLSIEEDIFKKLNNEDVYKQPPEARFDQCETMTYYPLS